jgi:hypothetical protein
MSSAAPTLSAPVVQWDPVALTELAQMKPEEFGGENPRTFQTRLVRDFMAKTPALASATHIRIRYGHVTL